MDNSENQNLDHEKLVTVYKTGNEAILSLIKSIFDEAGINYLVAGEGVQDLIGIGVFGTGFNPATGPVRIKVLPEDEDFARELLKDISEDEPGSGEEGEKDES